MKGLTILIDPGGRLCQVSDHAVADRLANGYRQPPQKRKINQKKHSKTIQSKKKGA